MNLFKDRPVNSHPTKMSSLYLEVIEGNGYGYLAIDHKRSQQYVCAVPPVKRQLAHCILPRKSRLFAHELGCRGNNRL